MTHLSDAHGDRQGAQLLVEGDEHARLHGGHEVEQNVVRLAQDD